MTEAFTVHSPASDLERGVRHQLLGELDAAGAAFEAAIHAAPSSAAALNNLGFVRAQQGRLDEAIALFEQVLAIDPERSMAHANLALVHVQRGEIELAIVELERAVELDSDNQLALGNLGRLLLAHGRTDRAEAAFRAALVRAEDADLRIGLALALAARGRQRAAEAELRRVVAHDPRCARAFRELGVVLMLEHDLGSACDAFRQALGLVPEDTRTRHQLATALIMRGDRIAAEQELCRVLAFEPRHVPALTDLAVLALGAGSTSEAERLLDQVPEAEATPRVRYYRALACERTDEERAKTELTRVVESGDQKYSPRAAALLDAYGGRVATST